MGYKVTGIYVGSDKVRPPAPITERGSYHNAKLGIISFSSNGSTWYTIADRNIGATKYRSQPGATAAETYGYYYQWGNNYGFDPQGTITTASGTVSVASTAAPGSYTDSTFRTGSGSKWMTTFRKNLRGDTTNTNEARRGPCPEGYHIMTNAERGDMRSALGTITGTYNFRGMSWAILMPICGRLSKSTGALEGADYYNNNTAVWTSSVYDATAGSVYCPYGTGTTTSNWDSNYGFVVRPYKNDPVQPVQSADRVKLTSSN